MEGGWGWQRRSGEVGRREDQRRVRVRAAGGVCMHETTRGRVYRVRVGLTCHQLAVTGVSQQLHAASEILFPKLRRSKVRHE